MQYNTVNFVRTMEEVLGIAPMNLNDAPASPMAVIFTTTPGAWTFAATPAPTRKAQYRACATRGMDFSSEDRFDFARYSRILRAGLMGRAPYTPAPAGRDLRRNRMAHLERELTPRK